MSGTHFTLRELLEYTLCNNPSIDEEMHIMEGDTVKLTINYSFYGRKIERILYDKVL